MDIWRRHLDPDGPSPVEPDLTPHPNLPAAWAEIWRAHPDRAVIHDPVEGWVTGGTIDARSRTVAGRYAKAGLRPGDRMLISCASSIDLVVAHVAALRSGLVVLPTNTAYRAGELAHLVRDAGPKLAVVDNDERATWLTEADPGITITDPAVGLPDGPTPELDAMAPDDPAMIGYTSGTTGAPKGAVLAHGNLVASVEALRLAWRWTTEDRLVLCLPLFHMHGLGVGLHGTLTVGASAVLLNGFDVDTILDTAAEHTASLFFGVPTMYSRLVDSPRAAELAQLRLCVSGSAPLPAALHERFEKASGQRVLERYGMTETVMLVSNPYDGERRAGSVGFPLPGVELELDPTSSEVLVRGPNVFAGYWNRPEANDEAFDDRGFFRTGDVGSLDDDGYLALVGRAKELVISGGFNVYPREVEDALRRHPGVVDAAVTGTPDDEWGEIVTAWLETEGAVKADEAMADEVMAFVGDQVAAFKRPRIVHFVDELPRNALGKVQKHLLGLTPHPT